MTAETPAAPRLAFRVGVTGVRAIEPSAQAAIERDVAQVLGEVARIAAGVAGEAFARGVYAQDERGRIVPDLRVVSPLADGADRLVADHALRCGYRLDVALPFARDDYVQDFDPSSRRVFDAYLDPAPGAGGRPYLAVDGARGDDENRSYEAVGQLVARNCDLLIAIWDGRPAKGRGGTGDIVRFATQQAPPIWWIDAEGAAPPRLIRSIADLRSPETAPLGEAATYALADLLRTALRPATAHRHRSHGIIGWLVHHLGAGREVAADQARVYLSERPRPRRLIWQSYGGFLRLLGGWPPRSAALAGTPGYWADHHKRADLASVAYRDRYRSSYVLVFSFAMVAVICAIVSLPFEALEPLAASLEAVCLGLILLLVGLNKARDWQGRWIAYRLLAELCRKQEVLSLLGSSLPQSHLRHIGATAAPAPWAGWYFNALLRAAPLASGYLGGARLGEIRDIILARIVTGQIAYNRERRYVSASAGRKLSLFGEAAFLLTLLVVAAELFSAWRGYHEMTHGLSIVAAILPALSAAFVGVRAYAELELLEQQSARMEAILIDADHRIDTLPLDRPLASQDLASEVLDIASEMLEDVAGWADLFHLKAVEAG